MDFSPLLGDVMDEKRANWWQRWRAEAQETHNGARLEGQNIRARIFEYIFCLYELLSLTTIGHRKLGFPSAHPKINCVPVA